jgi:hypothetical protein
VKLLQLLSFTVLFDLNDELCDSGIKPFQFIEHFIVELCVGVVGISIQTSPRIKFLSECGYHKSA